MRDDYEIQVTLIQLADVMTDRCVGVAAPHPGEELDSGVVERPTEIEGCVGGVELGHPGDAGVVLVEENVDRGVGHGVEREVVGQVGLGPQLPEAVHELGELRWRWGLGIGHRLGCLQDTIPHRVVHAPSVGAGSVCPRALSGGKYVMLFSAHISDTSTLKALRRKTPGPSDVPGLRSARTAICAPFTAGVLPKPQLRREALLACWTDEDSLDTFLADHPTGQAFADGWQLRMELFRAVGVWPGIDDDMQEACRGVAAAPDGPTVAITIGTAHLRTILPFARVNKGLERQFLTTPNAIWGTALTNIPQRLVATLSIWENAAAAVSYMRTGAHGAAVKAHFDPKKDPTGHTFVTGGGFFGLRPISTSGSLQGRNPISTDTDFQRL